MQAFGPMFMIFRSLQKFSKLLARDLRAAEKFMKLFMLLVVSVRFLADVKVIPVNSLRFLTTRSLYFLCVLMPVPTAVPPIPKIFKSLDCDSKNSRDFFKASLY